MALCRRFSDLASAFRVTAACQRIITTHRDRRLKVNRQSLVAVHRKLSSATPLAQKETYDIRSTVTGNMTIAYRLLQCGIADQHV